MTINQRIAREEQRRAVANRLAREAYVDKLYKGYWKPPEEQDRGMFDFFETAALVGVLALLWGIVGRLVG